MDVGAITLAEEFCKSAENTDLILASDMLNLPLFLSLTRDVTKGLKSAVYFHENQITYPFSPKNKEREIVHRTYGMTNFNSALCADAVFFNSKFHMENFIEVLPEFLRDVPDFDSQNSIEKIKTKSSVLPVGLELEKLEQEKQRGVELKAKYPEPIILWNHRWDYDKNPEQFFRVLKKLKDERRKFKLIVLGQNSRVETQVFDKAKLDFEDELIHWGYTDSYEEYVSYLWASDILPVTSNQEFFGISAAEAIYCETAPILPNRLAYPELIPDSLKKTFLYDSETELLEFIASFKSSSYAEGLKKLSSHIANFSWEKLAPIYDDAFEALAKAS